MEGGLSIATNHTEKSWKTSLFRRRRSLPQIKASFASKRNSRSTSTEEDTLTSRISDPFFDYTINDDCSYSIIDVTPENPTPLLPFGQDQLVVSTTVNSSTVLYTQLHRPKDPEHLISLIQEGYDPNERDRTPDAMCPIHTIIRNKTHNSSECLEALLVYSNVDINTCAAHAMTALHFAAMNGDMRCVKLLLTFGASINAISDFDQTPMNIAVAHDREGIIKLLEALNGITAAFVEPTLTHPLPVIFRPYYMKQQYTPLSPTSSDESDLELGGELRGAVAVENVPLESIRISDRSILSQSHLQNLFTFNEEDLVTKATHNEPFFHSHISHLSHVLTFKLHNGHRVLSLDGGWMRCLVQIDMLEQLEKFTGQKVTDMFDVLVGSSSGALIILGLVYGECTLSSLRQAFFRMKTALFSNPQHEMQYNTAMLKNFIQAITGSDTRLSDITYPKVMIPAVYKENNDLQLKFFTNFANDMYSSEGVFETALAATATPTWFTPSGDHFVDSSILANNPTDYALTYLQCHYYLTRQHFPVSLVVSLGSGVHPCKEKINGIQNTPTTPTKSSDRSIANLSQIMMQSIIQSDVVSERCQLTCQQTGIKYFRFNPVLKETVSVTETDTRKLINMVLRSRIEMYDRTTGIEALKSYFIKLSESYNAFGGGLASCNSDATSPGGLFVRQHSSSGNSSDEGMVKQKKKIVYK